MARTERKSHSIGSARKVGRRESKQEVSREESIDELLKVVRKYPVRPAAQRKTGEWTTADLVPNRPRPKSRSTGVE